MGPGVEGLPESHAANVAPSRGVALGAQAGGPPCRPHAPGSRLAPCPDAPLRIALFSEVYWPMVSGVGVTLLRLTEALQRRGHQVRVYSATYPLPPGATGPRSTARPASPSSCTPTSSGPSRAFGTSWRTSSRFRPDVVHVATEFSLGIAGVKAARQLGIPIVASAHTDYDQYAVRYGVTWALRAGLALSPLVLRAGPPGALSQPDLRGAPAQPRGHPHRGLEPGRGPGRVPPALPQRGLPDAVRGGPGRSPRDLHRADRAGEESRAPPAGLGDARRQPRSARSSCSWVGGRWRRRSGAGSCPASTSPA